MANFRQLLVEDNDGWQLMNPSNPWEALRLAWMLWRYPDRVAALGCLKREFMPARCVSAPPSMPTNVERSGYDTSDEAQDKYFKRETVKERSARINEAGRRAMKDSANRCKEGGGPLRPGSVICEHEVPEKLVANKRQPQPAIPLFVEFINAPGPLVFDESFVDGKRRITIRF